MIVIKNLTKKFKKREEFGKKSEVVAVDHINLKIQKGEIFGLIGPNGAGKTTLLKLLSTLILPDEGTATIDGYDILKDQKIVKSKIGILVGEYTRALYWRLTAYRNLKFFASLNNLFGKEAIKRIDYLLDILGLKEWRNERVMHFSTGMKHKLALAIALLKDPPVLLFDEPLSSIDPLTAYQLKKFIKEELKDKTILWTSHNLYEIEEMCDRIGIINKGKIISEGSPNELKTKYWDYEIVILELIKGNPEAFSKVKGAVIKDNLTIEIKTKDITKTFLEIQEILKENNLKLKEIKTLKPTLEEIFIEKIKDG